MPLTRLRNRKADAYSVVPSTAAPRYYAFLTPGPLLAALYANDGTFLADRGTLPLSGEPPSAANGTLIASDPNAAVGPGALAWRSNDNELTVWDIAAAQLHTYEGTIAACAHPPSTTRATFSGWSSPTTKTSPTPTKLPSPSAPPPAT